MFCAKLRMNASFPCFLPIFYLDPCGLGFFRIAIGLIVIIKILWLFPKLGLIFAGDGRLPAAILPIHTVFP